MKKNKNIKYWPMFGFIIMFSLFSTSSQSASQADVAHCPKLDQSLHTAGWIPQRDGEFSTPDSLPLDTDYPVFDTRVIYFAFDSSDKKGRFNNYPNEGHQIYLEISVPNGGAGYAHWLTLPYPGGHYTIDNTNSINTVCGIRSWIGDLPVAGTQIQNYSLLGAWKIEAYEVGDVTPLATGYFDIVPGNYVPVP